jgi:hypothetical protein
MMEPGFKVFSYPGCRLPFNLSYIHKLPEDYPGLVVKQPGTPAGVGFG